MARIPKSLDTPFLHDAIVELWFKPLVKRELLPGIYSERLRNEWQAPKPNPFQAFGGGLNLSVRQEIAPTFTRQGFKLSVNPNSVVFNITDGYPGWSEVYSPLLKTTLPVLLDGNVVQPQRASIRFVNHVPTENVFELIKRFANDQTTDWMPTSRNVRWVLQQRAVNAVVNITSDQAFKDERGAPFGIIDITLHRDLAEKENEDISRLLEIFSELHTLVKQLLFVELLPKEFVAKFSPVY